MRVWVALGSFLKCLGIIFQSCSYRAEIISGSRWGHFGIIVKSFWGLLGIVLGSRSGPLLIIFRIIFRIILGSFWLCARVMLGSLSNRCRVMLGSVAQCNIVMNGMPHFSAAWKNTEAIVPCPPSGDGQRAPLMAITGPRPAIFFYEYGKCLALSVCEQCRYYPPCWLKYFFVCLHQIYIYVAGQQNA